MRFVQPCITSARQSAPLFPSPLELALEGIQRFVIKVLQVDQLITRPGAAANQLVRLQVQRPRIPIPGATLSRFTVVTLTAVMLFSNIPLCDITISSTAS